MAGNLQPLVNTQRIVNLDGTPNDYFIRWAQQRQIDIGAGITAAQAATIIAQFMADHPLVAGSGIHLTPTGNLNDHVTIAADVQAILDQITSTHGSILFRGASAWLELAPGAAGEFLQTAGAGADPVWAASGGGGGALTLINSAVSTGVSPALTVLAIPGSYKDLIVSLIGRTTDASLQGISIDVNGTPTADMQRYYAQAGAINADQQLGAAPPNFFVAYPGSTYAAGMVGSQEMTIFEYANVAFWKNFHFVGRQPNNTASGNGFVMQGTGEYRTTTTITSITATIAAGNWSTGSVMRVYGRG